MKSLATAFIALTMVVCGSSCSTPNEPTVSGQQDGHDYVDLGLPSGKLWATANVGANRPDDNGSYFAWGETAPKQNYEWTTYQLCNGSDSQTKVNKYCVNDRKGEVDNKIALEATDDAATANWGGQWSTPSREDWEELVNACDWEWVKNYNGTGLDVKMGRSKANGNKILLPFSGYYSGEKFVKNEGMYWTSTLYETNSHQAYDARVLTHNINCNNVNRKLGMAVRAVISK